MGKERKTADSEVIQIAEVGNAARSSVLVMEEMVPPSVRPVLRNMAEIVGECVERVCKEEPETQRPEVRRGLLKYFQDLTAERKKKIGGR